MTALHITAQSLAKTYSMSGDVTGEKKVLHDLSFQFSEGERIGIIGRNGAGKTTLLQLIAGIGVPTSGRLEINGKVTAIFTLGLGLREDLTGRENIYIDGELQGRTRAETESVVPATIDFAELGDFIDRPVRTYSTGMKARLAFSMLVHIEPEILIIDEALSVGDANFARKATAKMQELTRRGRILIVVSHSMGSIREMCNRCLWLDQGAIRMDGHPDTVTKQYLDEVRQVDEQILLKRFRRQIAQETLLPGWSVTTMQFQELTRERPVTILQTGEPTQLLLELATPPGAECQVELEFFRLDQLSVCMSNSSVAKVDAQGGIKLVADLGLLPLNYGVYGARAIVRHNGVVAARRTIFTEVVNSAPPKGGRPILVTPVHLTSRKVAS